MKRNFIIGMLTAPLLLVGFWGLRTLTAPGITVTEAEQKEILEEMNYTTEKSHHILPVFPFHVGYKGQAKEARLGDFKGKPTIVHVWATWCAPCLKELPEFNAFAARYAKQFNIIAISADVTDEVHEAQEKVTRFWKENSYANMHIVFDYQAKLSRALGITGVPATLFLDAKGKEIGRVNGIIYWSDPKIKTILERILVSSG